MKTTIYCKRTEKGMHNFYLLTGGEEFYLFTQNFRKGVQEYFGQGVSLARACDYSKSRKDSAIIKTMDKIPMFIKYIEKESGILVLEQTKKKVESRAHRHHKVMACA